MSSTFGKRTDIAGLIKRDDNAGVVSHLEGLASEGIASDGEKLLLGVLLLLPPMAAYDEAIEIFESLLDGPRSFEAAAWTAYTYASLQPDGSRRFEAHLMKRNDSAVALHLLSLIALADDKPEQFILDNQRSRRVKLFPFNIISALEHDPSIAEGERRYLLQVLDDLVVSRTAESDTGVCTTDGLLSRKWDNLIVGTRLTSQYWKLVSDQGA